MTIPVRVLQAHANCTVGPVQSEDVKFVYTVRGMTRITYHGGAISLRQGEMAMLPPRKAYTEIPISTVETATLYVDPQFALEQVRWLPSSGHLLEDLFSGTLPRPLAIAPHHRQEVREHLGALARLSGLLPHNDLDRMAHLARVLSLVLGKDEAIESRLVRMHPQIEKAVALLERHLEQPWSVSLLAESVNLSPSHLTRLFVRHTGSPPSRFLREARAHRMHEILTRGEHNVSAAGRSVGWSESTHASRSYKSVFGRAPSSILRSSL